MSHFKIHIAVDFGTDGTALAYAYNGKVYIHNQWSSKRYSDELKPKTIILLDKKWNTLGFGLDAKCSYISMPLHNDAPMLFERFKMALYVNAMHDQHGKDMKRIHISNELTASNDTKCSADYVFISALKYIQSEAFKFMKKKKIKNVKRDEIQWIITVPAIWDDAAKYKMKEWAIRAGLIHIKIVYEPDCASLSIQHQIMNKKKKKKKKKRNIYIEDEQDEHKQEENDYFGIGDKYILVDAGGGTVDVACHEILSEFGVKEIVAPSGGPWGSCYIDDEYFKLLFTIFGAKWMSQFKQQYPNIYVEIRHNFEIAKCIFYKKLHKKRYNVRLPTEFISFLEHKIGGITQIEDIVSRTKLWGFSNLVSFEDEYLEIDVMVWRLMFDAVISPIILHIKRLLNESSLLCDVRYLLVMGGLSCSPYFQFKLKQHFGARSKYNLDIIIPERPMLSVVEGAALFGITPCYICARVLKKTYGIKASFTESKAKSNGVSQRDIVRNRIYIDHYNGYFVKNCFKVLGRKNIEIRNKDIVKYSCRRQPGCDFAHIIILCSDLEYPTMVHDGVALASFKLEFDAHDMIKDKQEFEVLINLEFHFYDTQLKVIAFCHHSPANKKEVQIKYVQV